MRCWWGDGGKLRYHEAGFRQGPVDAAVIGEEDEDRIVAKRRGVDGVREPANRLIETFDHGGVEGVFLW